MSYIEWYAWVAIGLAPGAAAVLIAWHGIADRRKHRDDLQRNLRRWLIPDWEH